ncbi:Indole-3-glycerol phosphate synthase [Maioricimonas rarisocia]|uniref:Indole-3-glycerol phosphate synthase n=1 Tax=Maioricimonas rarisocia TaxID=2528026 RepID=A0A517Z8N7_9PLAN|nr:indole-3-glycerol phosphate synthase TrpC [Maioricimonas rarisocia]QDU38852.1 Indole-3-glycerol phosphate synthase [Maioricimonas rarisocia]
MSDILAEIVAHKRGEIERARAAVSTDRLQQVAEQAPHPRDFVGALRNAHPMGLIAEVKKASPSAGLIREDFDPVEIARTYEQHGAACISVLTDENYFQGRLEYLRQVRDSVAIPVLRKDFILDPYQVLEARASGADCILLIAECLDDESLRTLYTYAAELGMQSLVEIYEPENLPRVLDLNPPLIGINNRNLKTFVTDLNHSMTLREQIPADVLLVSESGIRSRTDVESLQHAGIHAMLVGETLMRHPDIGQAVDDLLGRTAS